MPKAAITIEETGESFLFDNINSESYDEPVEVTDKTVEEGSPVADNANAQPRSGTIEYVVSEGEPSTEGQPPPEAKIEEAREFLRRAKEKFVTLETSKFGAISQRLIENFPHDIDTQNAVIFPVSFIEYDIAKRASVEFPDSLAVERHQGRVGSQRNTGRKATKSASEEQKSGPEAGRSENEQKLLDELERSGSLLSGGGE